MVTFGYRTSDGEFQVGRYFATQYSSFHELSTGETFSVRYNPKRPQSYWSDERGIPVEHKIMMIWAAVVIVFVLIVVASVSSRGL